MRDASWQPPNYPVLQPAELLPQQGDRLRWHANVHVTRADKTACDYLLVPFDVPVGLDRLMVGYQAGGAVTADITDGSGNVIDIGIWDPRGAGFQEAGFRGWSGSARQAFTLGAAHETTPGYVPGPIQAGRWHVVLGLYQVRVDGCEVKLSIQGLPQAGAKLSAEGIALTGAVGQVPEAATERGNQFLPFAFQGVLKEQPGWYRGDLQSHTHHSDAAGSLRELADAARAHGLDFLAVTDHNTITTWPYLAGAGGDDLLLIPAEEITTYYGHANVWGSSRWHDFRLSTPDAMAQIASEARVCGGVLSINHPRPHGPPWELGTDFDFDCLEVWNGWWQWWNHEALALWEELLQAGRRVVAVGGSDKHQGSQGAQQSVLTVGQPTTWVYAEDLSIRGILAGLRAGHVCVSAEPDGPQVRMEVVTAAGQRATMGEEVDPTAAPGSGTRVAQTPPRLPHEPSTSRIAPWRAGVPELRPGEDSVAPQGRSEVRVRVLGGAGHWLRLLCDGSTWRWVAIEEDSMVRAWPLEGAARYVRAQVEEEHPEGAGAAPGSRRLLALGNPVWFAR